VIYFTRETTKRLCSWRPLESDQKGQEIRARECALVGSSASSPEASKEATEGGFDVILPDISIDIETLSTTRDAVIVQIGLVYFDAHTGVIGTGYKWYPNIIEQLNCRRSIKPATIEWWLRTNPQLFSELITHEERIVHDRMQPELLAHFLDPTVKRIWAKHPRFDINILDSWYELDERMRANDARSYRKFLDVASVADVCGLRPDQRTAPVVAHDALSDAIAQAHTVIACYAKLRTSASAQ